MYLVGVVQDTDIHTKKRESQKFLHFPNLGRKENLLFHLNPLGSLSTEEMLPF